MSLNLYEGARKGSLLSIKTGLKLGVDINQREERGRTALHAAAGKGKLEIVRYLVSNGAKVDVRDARGITPLMVAAYYGWSEVVQYLLKHKADVNAASHKGETALIAAVQENHVAVIRILLAQNAKVNQQDKGGYVALHAGAFLGRLQAVEILLQKGALPDIQNSKGQTALMGAAQDNHIEIVSLLLEHKAKVNERDHSGETSLGHAAAKCKNAVVALLLKKGASQAIGTKDGLILPLHRASHNKKCSETLKLLADGTLLDAKTKKGWTSLQMSAANGLLANVKVLLKAGADVNTSDTSGMTPLMAAAYFGHAEIVRLLVEKGADPAFKDDSGDYAMGVAKTTELKRYLYYALNRKALRTLVVLPVSSGKLNQKLFQAVRAGGLDAVRLALKNGADVNTSNLVGITALTAAVIENRVAISQTLMDHGARFDLASAHTAKALRTAMSYKFKPLMQLIFYKGYKIKMKGQGTWAVFQLALDGGSRREVAELLEKNGLKLEKDGQKGCGLLVNAAREGAQFKTAEFVEFLLARGVDVNCYYKKLKITPLLMGAFMMQENQKVLGVLIKAGANLKALGRFGSPLLLMTPNPENRNFLVEQGADVNHVGKSKTTPLAANIKFGNYKEIAYYLKKGARTDIRDSSDRSALEQVLYTESLSPELRLKIMGLLVKYKVDVNGRDRGGRTVLMHAFVEKNGSIVKFLLENGADVNVRNVLGRNILFYSPLDAGLFETFIKRGANVNLLDRDGRTPLFLQIMNRNPSFLELLLKNGAHTGVTDKFGLSPLHTAIAMENLEMPVRRKILLLLLKHGADVNARTPDGQTLVQLARAQKKVWLVKLLSKYSRPKK